jgi:alpha-beta hydrolase superfamily lysophospholipase
MAAHGTSLDFLSPLCDTFVHPKPVFIHSMSVSSRSPPWLRLLYALASGTVLAFLTGCARPYVHPSPAEPTPPRLADTHAVMEDGYRLPLVRWEAPGPPRAIVLAVHGLNDYSHAFEAVGHYLSNQGITLIGYDQRGFGATAGHGLWHGTDRLTADLITMAGLIRRRHPDTPLYLLGESMGGAVVINALGSGGLEVEGVILVAPAVWSRNTMPVYQRIALWVAAHTAPGKQLTGEGLDLKPSDNIEMLRELARDAQVIKATRVDVLYGVSNLMDSAMQVSGALEADILLLYGAHDDIIPRKPTCRLVKQLNHNPGSLSPIYYREGYHMLTRDLQAPVVWADIGDWILGPGDARRVGGTPAFCVATSEAD